MFEFFKKAASAEAMEVSNALEEQIMNEQEVYENQVDENVKDEEDEWVWVPGYKATDFYMRGYGDFQFEMGKVFELPEGEDPDVCSKGFHFCPRRNYVRQFYHYGRLWKVKALIRKSEWMKAEEWMREHPEESLWKEYNLSSPYYPMYMKMAAKAIEFIEEIPVSEARKDFYKVDYYCESDEDYLDFIKWIADKKEIDAWYLNKYLNIMREAGISDLLSKVLWDGFKYRSQGKILANYALGLRNSGVSTDMMIYLMTKKASELAAS